MEKVQELKEKGNTQFKGKDFSEALSLYSQALTALGDVEASTQEDKDEVVELKVALISNRAACSLNLKDYDAVIESCNQALEYDPKHEKAHYRRSKAYSAKGKYDLALKDMTVVSQIRKNDRRTAAECEALRKLVEKERKAAEKERETNVVVDPFDDMDVKIVMGQACCSREKATEELRKSKGDVLVALKNAKE